MVNDRLREHFLNRERFDDWAVQYTERLQSRAQSGRGAAASHEPCQSEICAPQLPGPAAIEKAQQKDFAEIDRLLALLQHPYTDQPGMEGYAAPPPNWGKHFSVSCSS